MRCTASHAQLHSSRWLVAWSEPDRVGPPARPARAAMARKSQCGLASTTNGEGSIMMMSTNELATISDDRLDDVSGGAGPMPDQPEGTMSVGPYADPHNGGNACVPHLGQAAGHGI